MHTLPLRLWVIPNQSCSNLFFLWSRLTRLFYFAMFKGPLMVEN